MSISLLILNYEVLDSSPIATIFLKLIQCSFFFTMRICKAFTICLLKIKNLVEVKNYNSVFIELRVGKTIAY